MTDLREELRLIGCHANGDARCTCNIGQDALALIDCQAAEIERLTRERDEARAELALADARATAAEAERDALRDAQSTALSLLGEIIRDCNNTGLPNEIVADRVIERVEGWAMEARAALGRQP